MTLPWPKLSVVMPVHNGAAHLRPALESISAQTWRDFEAIVVDDGSTDETPHVLSEWANRDPRFRIIRHKKNLNVAHARNTGLDSARCALVLHADADDVNAPARFAAQAAAADRHPDVGIIGCDLRVSGRVRRYPHSTAAIRARLLWSCPFGQNAVMFNRRVLGDVRYDGSFAVCEDTELWLRTVFRTRAINLPEPLVSYRQRTHSLSGDLSANRMELERRIAARRSTLLGAGLDVDAAIAVHLGNRVMGVGAARIAAHIRRVRRRAADLELASSRDLQLESWRQIGRMWRNYGRRQICAGLPAIVAATLAFACGSSAPPEPAEARHP